MLGYSIWPKLINTDLVRRQFAVVTCNLSETHFKVPAPAWPLEIFELRSVQRKTNSLAQPPLQNQKCISASQPLLTISEDQTEPIFRNRYAASPAGNRIYSHSAELCFVLRPRKTSGRRHASACDVRKVRCMPAARSFRD